MQPNPFLSGKLEGFWGYGSGAGVAALAARQLGNPGFLILGGGFYDYEDVLAKTQFQPLKEAITKIKQTTGDRGIEFRSVAYDVSKLPKYIYVYHGSLDQVAPIGQTRAFADSLRTSGDYQVTFKVLEGTSHWLKTTEQQHVIRTILQTQKNGTNPVQNE
jgi:acetyl esterase/lipase